eukprot:14271950-Alexandrium_andersonii.AAC.1
MEKPRRALSRLHPAEHSRDMHRFVAQVVPIRGKSSAGPPCCDWERGEPVWRFGALVGPPPR